jgi:enamine deaminase RidA (YjgF/YER057c/UK114 family)
MIVTDIKRMHVAARFSDTAVFNGVVYLAGQVPTDHFSRHGGASP